MFGAVSWRWNLQRLPVDLNQDGFRRAG